MKKAFTLIELLVVMTIIGILMAILLPVISGGKVKAKRLKCQVGLKQITVSLIGFCEENAQRMPWHLTGRRGGRPRFLPKNIFAAYNFPSIAADLGSARILCSPCDTKREGVNRRMTLGRGNNGRGAIQNSGISYFIHHGGDAMNSSSMLVGTRNANFSAAATYYYPCYGALTIRGNGKIADSQDASWRGSYDGQRGLGMLRASQGQLGLADGSAEQMNDGDFNRALRVHGAKVLGINPQINNNIGAP